MFNVMDVVIYGLPLVLAVTLHEAAHGYVALRFGDDTALRAGRLTLNPIKHVDPFGTLFLPAVLFVTSAPFLFGYAKPVPVSFHRLEKPKFHMIWVAAAGPITNILLAFGSVLMLHGVGMLPATLRAVCGEMLIFSLSINVTLALFNLLPLPPLDGSRILVGLLPHAWGRPIMQLERWGLLIFMGLFFLLPFLLNRLLNTQFSLLNFLLAKPIDGVKIFLLNLGGF